MKSQKVLGSRPQLNFRFAMPTLGTCNFKCPHSLLNYSDSKKLPFGLKTSPSISQKFMNKLLTGYQFVFAAA